MSPCKSGFHAPDPGDHNPHINCRKEDIRNVPTRVLGIHRRRIVHRISPVGLRGIPNPRHLSSPTFPWVLGFGRCKRGSGSFGRGVALRSGCFEGGGANNLLVGWGRKSPLSGTIRQGFFAERAPRLQLEIGRSTIGGTWNICVNNVEQWQQSTAKKKMVLE